MNIKKLVVEFCTVFVVTLVITALVTFLWNFIGHGASAVIGKPHSVLPSSSASS